MGIFSDYVIGIYENLLTFEDEKNQTYENIDELQEFLEETDSTIDEIWDNVTDGAQSLLRQMNRLEDNFTAETETMLEELDNLENKIDEFIGENEELTNQIKEDMIDVAEKMSSNREEISDDLESFEEIIDSFNDTVTEVEPSLTQNLTNMVDFFNNVMLRGLENYQEIIDDQKDELEAFYEENMRDLVANEVQDLSQELADYTSRIEELSEQSKTLISNAEEFLMSFYGGSYSDLKDKYQEVFAFIENKLIDSFNHNQELIDDRIEELEATLEELTQNYSENDDQAQSLIEIFNNLLD